MTDDLELVSDEDESMVPMLSLDGCVLPPEMWVLIVHMLRVPPHDVFSFNFDVIAKHPLVPALLVDAGRAMAGWVRADFDALTHVPEHPPTADMNKHVRRIPAYRRRHDAVYGGFKFEALYRRSPLRCEPYILFIGYYQVDYNPGLLVVKLRPTGSWDSYNTTCGFVTSVNAVLPYGLVMETREEFTDYEFSWALQRGSGPVVEPGIAHVIYQHIGDRKVLVAASKCTASPYYLGVSTMWLGVYIADLEYMPPWRPFV